MARIVYRISLTGPELNLLCEALKHRASRHESMSRAKSSKAHDQSAAAMRKLKARLDTVEGEEDWTDMTSDNNDATRELLAEIARLREDIRNHGIVLLDIDIAVQSLCSRLRVSRAQYAQPPIFPSAED